MRCRFYVPLCMLLVWLAACTPVTPSPTLTPTPAPTFTPSPTPIPSPTPTATPIPPLALTIRWPGRVWALEPVPVEVVLVPPPGVNVTAEVRATVLGPDGRPYQTFDLAPREGHRYAAEERLQLPLNPLAGDWRLLVSVQSELAVEGRRELVFQPTPIRFYDLASALPAGVNMRVPWNFVQMVLQGDTVAGGRVWHHGDGELALWWAPGPTEPLVLDNAVVMLEATYDTDTPPQVQDVEEREWQGQVAFLFHEQWPGTDGGPAEALVVQGPDYHLYVLRIRALGGTAIPPLLRQVWETFGFVEE